MITKTYTYTLLFEPGSTVCEEFYKESLWQAVWRAQGITEHRIEIEAQQDPTDEREAGMAVRRLEALRQHFLAKGIAEHRLEVQPYTGELRREASGRFCRCADISLFPRVASLCPGIGEPFLTRHEVSLLQTARLAVIFNDRTQRQYIEERYGNHDWRRIVGHEHLEEWAAEGAHHPLYDRA